MPAVTTRWASARRAPSRRATFVAAARDAAARGSAETGAQALHFALAGAALSDDRDMLVEPHSETHRIDDTAPVVLGQRYVGDRELARQRHHLLRLGEQELG